MPPEAPVTSADFAGEIEHHKRLRKGFDVGRRIERRASARSLSMRLTMPVSTLLPPNFDRRVDAERRETPARFRASARGR